MSWLVIKTPVMAQNLLGDVSEVEVRYWYTADIKIISDDIAISIFNSHCDVVSRIITPVPVHQAYTKERFQALKGTASTQGCQVLCCRVAI